MRRTALFLACGLCPFLACGGEDEEAANEGRVVVNENLLIYTGVAAAQVTVYDDRLEMPAAGNETLLSRGTETVLVGDRGPAGGPNPSGFLRRFHSAAKQGTTIVVQTDPAGLPDAIVEGKFARTFAPDAQGSYAPKPGPQPQDVQGPTIKLIDLSGKEIVKVSLPGIPVPIGGETVTVSFSGSAKVSQGTLEFTPSFDIGGKIAGGNVEEFHAIATGKFDAKLALGLTGEAKIETTIDKKKLEGAAAQIAKDLAAATAKQAGLPVLGVTIPLPTFFIGPVPVVTDLRVDVDLECSLAFKGSLSYESGMGAVSTVKMGVRYQGGGVSPVWEHSFDPYKIGPNWTVGGGVEVGCGLKPQLVLVFYKIAGPYLYVKPYAKLAAEYAETCDGTSSSPDMAVDLKPERGVEAGVGAKLQILSLKLAKDFPLLDLKIPGPDVHVPLGKGGFGYCTVSCGDGACNNGETCQSCAKDCGACPATCGNGKCDAGETCSNCSKDCGACPATCGNSTCETGETCANCSKDCGACCPNGKCDNGETCTTCAQDCGACPPTDPCNGKNNGKYCGQTSQFPGGTSGTLYTCSGGKTVGSTACQYGCLVNPPGTDDACKSAPTCGGYGGKCTTSADCCSGNLCQGGFCCANATGTKQPGDACGASSQCCSNKCGTSGICCGNQGPGCAY